MHSNSYTDNVRDSKLAGPAAREAGCWKGGWRLMRIAGLGLTAFLFAAAASCLDGGGRLSGLLTDPSGGAMAGVAVQAIGAETGLQFNAVTSAEGFYVFPVLPVGHYELRIDQAGFKPYRRKNVDVTSSSAARADAVILADIGLLDYAARRHPGLRRHLSVQAAASNPLSIDFYREAFGVSRVVLPRVLAVKEVAALIARMKIEAEVFAFGSLGTMVEGRCYLSSYLRACVSRFPRR